MTTNHDATRFKLSEMADLGLQFGAVDIPIVGSVIAVVKLITLPIYEIYAHHTVKPELKVVWQRADKLGLNGADLKRFPNQRIWGRLIGPAVATAGSRHHLI
jgi:hypothetical protein